MLPFSATECPCSTILQAAHPEYLLGQECVGQGTTQAVLRWWKQDFDPAPEQPLRFVGCQGAVADSSNGAGNGSRLY